MKQTHAWIIGLALLCAVTGRADGPDQGMFDGPGKNKRGPLQLPTPDAPPADLYKADEAARHAALPFGVDNPFVLMNEQFKWNGARGAALVRESGAGWIMPAATFGIVPRNFSDLKIDPARPGPPPAPDPDKPLPVNFDRHDAYVRYAQALNLHILFVVGTRGAEAKPVIGPQPPGMPANLERWTDFVTRVIERYDGDGRDDMPGLRYPVRYWMIMNEPFYPRYWAGTIEEYLQAYLAARAAIKTADPEARVILSSLYTPYDETTRGFAAKFITLYGQAVREKRAPATVDGLDLHWISRKGADEGFATYRDAWSWLTREFASHGVTIDERLCTEACMLTTDRDALRHDLVKRLLLARTLGLGRIFWSSLMCSDPGRDPFTGVSLSVGPDDPVLAAYARLARIAGANACRLADGQPGVFDIAIGDGARVMWATTNGIPTPAGAAHIVTDVAGNPVTTPGPLTSKPVYVERKEPAAP